MQKIRNSLLTLTCVLCWSSFGWARPVEMSCYQAGQVVSQVQVAVSASLRPDSARFSKAIQQLGQGRCLVSLRYLINSKLDDLLDQELPYDGVNCWSSTMLLKGLRKTAIYMHEPEVKWIFDESKACRKLGPQEQPKTGDIGAIRQFNSDKTKTEELHAFIYLNPEMAISKQSFSFEAQIELTHPDQFFNQFGGKDAGVECESSKNCSTFTTYYRCESSQFQNPDLIEEPFLYAKIQSLAEKLELDWRQGAVLSKNPVKDEAYLAEIAELNESIFGLTPQPKIPYGIKLFESAVWQYTALQAGARTPMKGKE